jgi:hypothetical protein
VGTRGLRFRLLHEHNIRVSVAAQDTKILAIRRPVEREELLGIKVRNLAARSAVDGLNPDVIHTILTHGQRNLILLL